jgi:hypothetical protein
MNRVLLFIVLPLVAAAASILNIVSFWLGQLMRPSWPAEIVWSWRIALVVIVAGTIVAMRGMTKGRILPLVIWLAVIVGAGFAPQLVDLVLAEQRQAEEQAAGAAAEMELQASLLDMSDDIEARIAANDAMSAEEGMTLLDFAASADLSWRSLPDHTREAFALVQQALDAKILDPNALTTSAPTADAPAVTLTLLYWEKRIRAGSPSRIEKHPWELLQMLVAAGADLSSPDAAPLNADLAKAAVDIGGRFIRLE